MDILKCQKSNIGMVIVKTEPPTFSGVWACPGVFGHVWAFFIIYLVDPRKKVDLYKRVALDGHVQTLLGMPRAFGSN